MPGARRKAGARFFCGPCGVRGFFSSEAGEQSPRYYGWIVVGVTFLTMAIGGSIVGTFSVFYVAFLDEFGWSRADTALGFSASMVTFAFSAGLIGALIDRFGPRRVIPFGVAVLGGGLLLMSTVSSLGTLYLYYGVVVAVGITLIGFVPTSAVVSRWFVRRRATAMGIALSGRSCGGLVMIPLTAFLIGVFGWRSAYLLLAAGVTVVLLPLTATLHRDPPALPEERSPAGEEGGWTLRQALGDAAFWLLFLAGIFGGLSFSIVGLHQIAHMVDVGIGKLTAASLIGSLAVLRTLGGVTGGWVGDRVGRLGAFLAASAASLAGVFLLMNASAERWPLVYLYVLLYGLGEGARGTAFVSLKADIFPGRSFGRILGFSQVGAGLASAVGPWLAGYIFDVLGSYRLAFWLVAVVKVLSMVTVAGALLRARGRLRMEERVRKGPAPLRRAWP